MSSLIKCLIISILFCGILYVNPVYNACAYDVDNDFIPDAFPKEVVSRTFSIPIDQKELVVIYPEAATSSVDEMQSQLKQKCGRVISFLLADDLSDGDLKGKHLIIIGNISNNKWALELYKRRYAFADAYFPGKYGVVIHPVTSIWDPNRYVLVIGVSRDYDLVRGFESFLGLLEDGVNTIHPIHHLKTSLKFPTAPGSVESTLDNVRNDIKNNRGPYRSIPDWGFCYYLTGEKKWAEHFRDGMYLLYERAEKTGQWIPESWTNVYFSFSRIVYVWDLLDEDTFFTENDRKIFEEVLWGYFNFCRGKPLPLLEPAGNPPGDIRQNHATFMALSLFFSYRYYTEKYGMEGLDDVLKKIQICFDGQLQSYRPNDDAGTYLTLTPLHTLTYAMCLGDETFIKEDRLGKLADLVTVCFDNRGDMVSFGDVGGYSHWRIGARRGRDVPIMGMAAFYYQKGEYQWLYDWRAINRSFSLSNLYSGEYAVDIQAQFPERLTGIHPVILDEAAIQWHVGKYWHNSFFPLESSRYFDKMSFRTSFSPNDEYLLLDGTSSYAHGHQDGNTVARLTWKDCIWLVDADYINLTPKYHNGIIVVKDGIQEEPPPLTVLDYSVDFDTFGFSRTVNRDFNGADWERNIIWKKGKYFLFLDEIIALSEGEFRTECRWRTLGDVSLSGNVLSAQQGDTNFFIQSADEAYRQIVNENEISVCHARKDISLKADSSWVFANLMYATNASDNSARELSKQSEGTYLIQEGKQKELIGMNTRLLADRGFNTNCSLYILDSQTLFLANATFMVFGDVYLEADSKIHLELDYLTSRGLLIIPEESKVTVKQRNLTLSTNGDTVILAPGKYSFSFPGSLTDVLKPLMALSDSTESISPELVRNVEDFGIEVLHEFTCDSKINAFCQDGESLLCGYENGKVIRYTNDRSYVLFQIIPARKIVAITTADVDSDGSQEILIGDDGGYIYCYDSSGRRKWNYKMSPYFGGNANASDITVGDIDNNGENTVLVATNGWKLYAFEPDGTVKWESFIYYHPLTKVKILKNPNQTYIAVGTVYTTPLNVVDPADGSVSWFTWEQVGDEFLSTTDFCGFYLTDMALLDTNSDGEKDIVFGTKYNRVYALNAFDGATIWEANVGSEVTGVKLLREPHTGESRIVVSTDAGDLVMLDRTGMQLNKVSLGRGISDFEVVPNPENSRVDIIVSTNEGSVFVSDDQFNIRASKPTGTMHLKGVIVSDVSKNSTSFYMISNDCIYLMEYKPVVMKINKRETEAFSVAQNSPNPFNPTTTFSFSLAESGNISIDIYNIAGQKVDTIANEFMNAGTHSTVFNGSEFSAGVYFYSVKSNGYSKTMKMTLLK